MDGQGTNLNVTAPAIMAGYMKLGISRQQRRMAEPASVPLTSTGVVKKQAAV